MADQNFNSAQASRIESLRATGFTVKTEPLDGYPNWVYICKDERGATGFYAEIPEDGGKITRRADWLA